MKALVFGHAGQIGSYLVELLLSKGYQVVCPPRKVFDFEDLQAYEVRRLFELEQPDEIYNMVGLNYAPDSWFLPSKYLKVNGLAVEVLLTIMKGVVPNARFFQAGSAEVFEKSSVFQAEDTNRLPANPYGISKMLAMELTRIYREKYGMFCCTGIFFNAESPRRKKSFFAEKVANEVVRMARSWLAAERYEKMLLGRLDAKRDWGWAPEYAEVAWLMLRYKEPKDFVIGTGETHTCLEFVEEALRVVGIDSKDMNKFVQYEKDMEFSQNNCMRANPAKAEKLLGWKAKYKFKDVVRMLVEAEVTCQEKVPA